MDGTIHCKLSTLMGAKRATVQDVHNSTGLSRNTISNLYYDRATRVDYETVSKLCGFLNCSVGDLLVIENEPSK